MLSDITIYRDYPVVNGFVQYPNNKENRKTAVKLADAVVAIEGAEVKRLSIGSGKSKGSKCGQQEWLRLPGLATNDSYAANPTDVLDSI